MSPLGPGSQPASAGDALLDIRGLCVDYGIGEDAVHAVVQADLLLRRGEVLGLAGESGSGKSTLAYAAVRLLRAPGMITGGEVLYYPHDAPSVDLLDIQPTELRTMRWSQIAVVLQSAMNALNPVISIGAQLTDVLRAHLPGMGAASRRARAAELLSMVGISAERLTSYPHELSGGMRQRVMIAMALALEPQVVIMDEPTTALDVVTQREILEELSTLRERLGFAVLFITHDLSLLAEIADSIAVMYAGRLVEQAAARALFHAPRHPYTLGLLNSFPALHGPRQYRTGIPGSPPDLRLLPAGCVFHPRCPYAMDRCREQSPPLRPPILGEAAGDLGRLASCWLLDGSGQLPPELAAPEPAASGPVGVISAAGARPARPPPPRARSPAASPPQNSGASRDPARCHHHPSAGLRGAAARGPRADQAFPRASRRPGPAGPWPAGARGPTGRPSGGARRGGRVAGAAGGRDHRGRRRERLGQVHPGPDAGPADRAHLRAAAAGRPGRAG